MRTGTCALNQRTQFGIRAELLKKPVLLFRQLVAMKVHQHHTIALSGLCHALTVVIQPLRLGVHRRHLTRLQTEPKTSCCHSVRHYACSFCISAIHRHVLSRSQGQAMPTQNHCGNFTLLATLTTHREYCGKTTRFCLSVPHRFVTRGPRKPITRLELEGQEIGKQLPSERVMMLTDATARCSASLPSRPRISRPISSSVRRGIVKTGHFNNLYESRNQCRLRTLHVSFNQ